MSARNAAAARALPVGIAVMLAALNGGTHIAAASGIPFVERPVATVAGARSVAAADMDGDLDVDVVSASFADGMILWHESDGGTPPAFNVHIVSADAGAVVFVQASDLDDDGDADVLSVSRTNNEINWYENDGGSPPAFVAHAIVFGALAADAAFAVDLDGDDAIDVAASASAFPVLAWYRNEGGTPPAFSERTIATSPTGPFAVHGADVDGDGDVDLLVASRGDGTLAWYESDGGMPPAFTEHIITTAAAGAAALRAADLDGDDDLDLVAASHDDDTLAWYESDGGMPPVFTERLITLSARGAAAAVPSDLDDDGDTDILLAAALDDSVAWYENDGQAPPSFTERIITNLFDGAVSVVAIDMDADDDSDVVAAAFDGNAIRWYENAPLPVLNVSRCTYHATIQAAITAAGDGDEILAVREQFLAEPVIDFEDKRLTLRSSGTIVQPDGGHYTLANDARLETTPDRILTINGSLILPPGAEADILTRAMVVDDGAAVTVGTGSGLFIETTEVTAMTGVTSVGVNATMSIASDIEFGGTPPVFSEEVISMEAFAPFGVYAADLDGDGDPDLLSVSFGDTAVAWYEHDGQAPPGFTRRVIETGVLGARSVHAADVDGDGDVDAMVAAQISNKISWYENDGGSPPTFTPHVVSTNAVTATSVYAADVDGDGDVDLLSASFGDFKVAWYENDGGLPPQFTERIVTTNAAGAFSVYAADMDADGDTDVLSASQLDNKVAWYENDGGAPPGFTERLLSNTSIRATAVFAADLDGDGDIDALSASQVDGKIAWYENEGGTPPTFESRTISLAAPDATSVHAADVDGDGDVDVLATAQDADKVAWYVNNGQSPPVFGERILSDQADGAQCVTTADLDLDGDTDIVAASADDNTIAWFRNLRGRTTIDAGGAVASTGAIRNELTVGLFGGHLGAADGFENLGQGTLRGFGTIAADVVNSGRVIALADTEVVGDYRNTGLTIIQGGTFTVLGAFENEGQLIGEIGSGVRGEDDRAGAVSALGSDGAGSSGGGFFVQSDLAVAASATLRLPSPGAVARLGGAYDVAIDDAARYDTSGAEVRFVGLVNQTMEVMSVDIGPSPLGLDGSQPGHFPIGTLRLGPTPTTVRLRDAHDNDGLGQSTCEAVYVSTLVVDAGATLITDGCRVYYEQLVLDGTVDDAGNLVEITPPCPGDIDDNGVIDFADIVQLLGAWGPCPPEGECRADVNEDGVVDFGDVVVLLGGWGECERD